MKPCITPGCGSYAINPHLHGRLPGVDLDLCDVCYWRKRATPAQSDKSFTRALIRAAKRSMSGQSVDLTEVVAKVADTEPKYITDADISHHLTNALSDLMQLTGAQRSDLYDILHCQSPAQRRHILCKLAFTKVATLRTLDLWRDNEVG